MNDVNGDCLATSEVTTEKISELQEEIEPTTSEIYGRRKLESLNYGNSHHVNITSGTPFLVGCDCLLFFLGINSFVTVNSNQKIFSSMTTCFAKTVQ